MVIWQRISEGYEGGEGRTFRRNTSKFWDIWLNYRQVSRHKKVKNIREQTKDSAPNKKLPLRLK